MNLVTSLICLRNIVLCGVQVKKKDIAVKRFGKYLCFVQHTTEFTVREQQRQNEESNRDYHGLLLIQFYCVN
jgi:hypothetical protein